MTSQSLHGFPCGRRESTYAVQHADAPEIEVGFEELRGALGATSENEQSFQECHGLSRELFTRGAFTTWVIFPTGETHEPSAGAGPGHPAI